MGTLWSSLGCQNQHKKREVTLQRVVVGPLLVHGVALTGAAA
jgi:hypothetical protein